MSKKFTLRKKKILQKVGEEAVETVISPIKA